MSLVVTGIAQSLDVRAFESALRASSVPLSGISIISAEYSPSDISGTGMTIVDPGTSAVTSSGGGIITSSGGTGVPGITRGQRHEFFRNHGLADKIADLDIPDTAVEHFVEAVEAGRSVVVFYGTAADQTTVEAAFTTLGLKDVRTFTV